MARDGGKKAKEEEKSFMKKLKNQMKMIHPDFDEEGEGSRGPTSHRVRTNLEWCRQQRSQRQAEYDQLMAARKSIDNLLNQAGQESEWVLQMLEGVAAQREPGACDGPIPPDFFETSFGPEPPSEIQGQRRSSFRSNSKPMNADNNLSKEDATNQSLNSNDDNNGDTDSESASKKARIDERLNNDALDDVDFVQPENKIPSTSYEKIAIGGENDETAQF